MTLSLIPGTTTDPTVSREAWARVLEGYERALEVPGLSIEDRGVFLRLRGPAAELAGRPQLTVTNTHDQDGGA
jgi:hypothetical protein